MGELATPEATARRPPPAAAKTRPSHSWGRLLPEVGKGSASPPRAHEMRGEVFMEAALSRPGLILHAHEFLTF